MRNVDAPPSGGRLQRSVAACLAAVLELEVGEIPLPHERHPEPWTVWRNWLAQRALGLVPINEPARFNWPGPWLALLSAADGEGQVGAVAFGSPPGIAWHPLGGPEGFDALEAGYLVAPADVALWTPGERPAPQTAGVVEAIVVAADAEAPLAA